MHLKSDTLLKRGEYRIIDSLGRGGFGITYLAEQVNLHRKVCIKEFFPKDYYKRDEDSVSISLLSDSFEDNMSRFRAKFVKEAQTIATLNHANIIPIYDIFEENGTAYYVMDYIDGESLSERVKRGGAMSERDAVAYIKQVASALEHIHEQQIMHLDVKPGNIMVRSKDNRAILIDFGLSKHYDATSGEATSTTPVGVSHGYAPMEQYKQGGVNRFSPETDIYSLGATLYYLVTGNVPPQAADIPEEGIVFPTDMSSNVRETIAKSMSYLRKDRPHTIKDFLELLDNDEPIVAVLVDEEEKTKIAPHKPSPKRESNEDKPKQKKRRWWLWFVVAVAVVVVISIFYLSTMNHQPPSDISEESVNDELQLLVDKGIEYYEQNRFQEAFECFSEAAEQGHAEAQCNLGYCYYLGQGVDQNYAEAVKWYRKAADQGDAKAQTCLGVCYSNGEGVDQNYAEAVKWCRRAAEQGEAYAQCNLGYCYEFGEGVDHSYTEAAKWYRKAAEQGHAMAQYNLGGCYYDGRGVDQDYAEAVKWYRKAAEQGIAEAQYNLGVCYYNGQCVDQNYAEAVKWYRKAAEQGDVRAQYNLGVCYYNGQGVDQNYAEAVKWYRKAAEQGDVRAQYNLGICYYNGDGVDQNYTEAVKWLSKAADQSYADAQYSLGVCYYNGDGVDQNYTEAVKWLSKAADQGHDKAQTELRLLGETW